MADKGSTTSLIGLGARLAGGITHQLVACGQGILAEVDDTVGRLVLNLDPVHREIADRFITEARRMAETKDGVITDDTPAPKLAQVSGGPTTDAKPAESDPLRDGPKNAFKFKGVFQGNSSVIYFRRTLGEPLISKLVNELNTIKGLKASKRTDDSVTITAEQYFDTVAMAALIEELVAEITGCTRIPAKEPFRLKKPRRRKATQE